MKRRMRIIAGISWGVATALAVGLAIAHTAGLRLNLTHSAPIGLWHVRPVEPGTLARGQLVEICPPPAPVVQAMREHGYLSTGWIGRCEQAGVMALLKPVAAVAGDLVSIRQGVPAKVNGVPLVNTRANAGIPAWPDGDYIVSRGWVWVFSSYSAASFDSRYFGPVPAANVRGQATPIFIRGTAAMTNGATAP